MSKDYYYTYCKDVLGVCTNTCDFRWIYGSVAPEVQQTEFEKCAVKFYIRVVPEKKLPSLCEALPRFQSYSWADKTKTLSCRRSLFRVVELGYDIRIDENNVFVTVGSHYYRLVQNRVMNLHSMYYLLADLANVMLLQNGYLTMYASAVFCETTQRCIVSLAAPNTGKTLAVTTLCEGTEYRLVGEDVVITDGLRVFSCPWTRSYRKKGAGIDTAGSFGRKKVKAVENMCQNAALTNLAVLSLGEPSVGLDKEEVLARACVLNGYLFQYYSAPIVKLLSYFCKEFRINWNARAEQMLEELVERTTCAYIQCEAPVDFAKMLRLQLLGD